MRILKFGGTSVATPARRSAVARIVKRAASRGPVTVVTSALGGVTDELQAALDRAERHQLSDVVESLGRRHLEGVLPAGVQASIEARLDELQGLLEGVARLGECPPSSRHRILAVGERLALPLVAETLRGEGLSPLAVDGTEVIRTVDALGEDGDPIVDLQATRERARALAERSIRRGEILLVTGFVAGEQERRTTTLGRGASDLTATVLGRVLEADGVEIWSDVDGVLSAPPRLVPGAFVLDRLTYGEAAGLALFGAKVLHPRTLEPVAEAGIPVIIRNTWRPDLAGTRIDGGAGGGAGETVVAVTAMTPVCRIAVRSAWRRVRLMSRSCAVLEQRGLRPLLASRGASGQSLSLVVEAGDAGEVERALRRELCGATDGVELCRRDGVSVVAAVGRGGARTACSMIQALEGGGVATLGVAMPSAGDSTFDAEPIAAVLVDADQAGRAVELLHASLVRGPRVEVAA